MIGNTYYVERESLRISVCTVTKKISFFKTYKKTCNWYKYTVMK